jgi:hypothetical protein
LTIIAGASLFVRDLSHKRRYCSLMTRLGDLFDAMAERFTSINYIGRGAVVAEMFIYGRATMIGDARYIVDACDAAACEVAVDVAEDLQAMWLAPHPRHAAGRSCHPAWLHGRRRHDNEHSDNLTRQAHRLC